MTEQGNANVQASTSTQTTIDELGMYNVYLLNDDYIHGFCYRNLKQFLENPIEDAEAVMLKIHEEGKGVAGTYP